ncbi:sulfatase-like hydrolase/transferase [Verrucomicrobiaceae bacterium R5-34]|uniref:Sulfatase-like hydrolase/transferase n=1 Tax=Oceaniferula flava TaxID=2800421 RepID=A0AAE2SD70_9BACT|nr:sulfatase/phosphatase domain-containing protein [Oceaniferula flavus]MBK1830136.1 sulfatase-like hydrolase/transferase [Verrucomicrobiaceae bacterium R5-34]MBK1854724.1 sulfatase-like hydrolase/transferase [Oceaniferula flavus]MBM1136030.1 sulfatase-like hydrolase/transferase [Oceaniferula flavus]
MFKFTASSVVAAGAVAIAATGAVAAEKQPAAKPNILFFFSDDHAVNAISAYGGPLKDVAPTPGIDRLANEGMISHRTYCANSICGPSRACILTGKHSHLNGFMDNNNSHFDGKQQTFPQLLQGSGYQTAMIGKWHLHSDPVGFDYWEILPGQGNYYNPDMLQMDGSKKKYEGHVNDIVTERGLTWLKKAEKEDKPFVAMIQYKAPHRNWSGALRHITLFDDITMPEPDTLFDDYSNRSKALGEQAMSVANHMYWGHDMKFNGPNLFPKHFASGLPNREYMRMNDEQKKAWDKVYEPKNQKFIADMKAGKLDDKAITRWKYQRYIKDYLRSIRSMDEGIGKILKHLDDTGLADNTIVIYSSDQGFYLGEHGWYDKRWMFEESFRMPFLVRWPGVIKPGSVSKSLIQNIDFAPTFLELCGMDIPSDIQGKSLVPVFKASGKEVDGWRDAIYYRYTGESTHAVAAHDGVRTDRYKLMWLPETKEWQLFDLEKDPQEMKSLHNDPEYAQVLADMKKKLDEIREKYDVHNAVIPESRNQAKWWKQRQEKVNKLAAEGPKDLIFVGDSITQGFERAGKAAWDEYYADRNALNLGFSGDRTEHILWRLNNGNLRKQQKAKVVVLMAGTNNTGHLKQDPAETAQGIKMIVSTIRARCPQAKILVLGVFPRGEKPSHPLRKINEQINERIAKLADGERIHFLDISDKFLDENGVLTKEIMPDSLHPKQKGYDIWVKAMEPTLNKLGIAPLKEAAAAE